MAISGKKINIKGSEELPVHIFVVFCHTPLQAGPIWLSFLPFLRSEMRSLEVNWKKPYFLNFSAHTGRYLKVNVPKNQNYGKKSLNQEKLAKFAFAQVLWEILDFHFSGPKIKKFNNNQKFLKHPDFSTLEYYK